MTVTSPAEPEQGIGTIAANQFEASLGVLNVDELDQLARLTSLTEEQARTLSAHLVSRAQSLYPAALPPDHTDHPPVAQRLVSWWKDRNKTLHTGRSNGFTVHVGDPGSAVEQTWSQEQLRAIQMTWGDGFMEPGGKKFAEDFIELAGLKSDQTALDLTTGLAGTAAHAAENNGLWIDALDPDPVLAERARAMIDTLDLSERVKVRHADFNNLELPARHYDAAFSRERLFVIEHKKQVLQRVAESLKQDGALLLTDFTIGEDETNHADLKEWTSSEPRQPFPWSAEFYRQALEFLGFDIKCSEDISEEYIHLIHQGWLKTLRKIDDEMIDPQLAKHLIKDGEIWLARANAMKSGVLSIRKIHAVLQTAPDPE